MDDLKCHFINKQNVLVIIEYQPKIQPNKHIQTFLAIPCNLVANYLTSRLNVFFFGLVVTIAKPLTH